MEHLFTTLSPSTETPILSSSLPTLLIFECVLAYISPEISSRLLEWFVAQFSKSSAPSGGVLGCVVYEMFGLGDTFGRVMVNNLKARLLPCTPHLFAYDFLHRPGTSPFQALSRF
jgi:[phosphatase 2A protein]-leucine-carboxy methyltransferase